MSNRGTRRSSASTPVLFVIRHSIPTNNPSSTVPFASRKIKLHSLCTAQTYIHLHIPLLFGLRSKRWSSSRLVSILSFSTPARNNPQLFRTVREVTFLVYPTPAQSLLKEQFNCCFRSEQRIEGRSCCRSAGITGR
ncbi:hypothetical protein QCA50_016950 [Cerrena zonata]|uniref:Uncharacterized protein n=1 Tax=Cerrena zonata TaxID=2478898 RepID=A0AAW0FP28_9APHY